MADWLSLVFALIIVGCFLMLGRFIIRLGVMEREAFFDHLNPPPREIPSQHMVGVKNPFLLKLKSDDETNGFMIKTDAIEFLLSTTTPCYVTFYWEVKKTAMDAVLCEENRQQTCTFDDAQDDSSDSDLEDAPSMHVIPLEHILQGSYKDRSTSEFYEAGSEIEIFAVPPSYLEHESPVNNTGMTNSLKYALVVTVEMSMRDDEHGPQQLSDIVAHITVINLSRSSAGKLTSSIEMQCVQTTEGKIYSIKKLFVAESDDITETQTSPPSQRTSTQVASSSSLSPLEDGNLCAVSYELSNAVCIVCRALPVTRAFLPCRHACICGLCFQKLSYCPMCRGSIQSYFKVQDEPFIDDAESDVSTELKRMSVGEILRGVFSAS